ncbi:hypothetical protein FB107DRAFT_249350 [Schizophyllum commune]
MESTAASPDFSSGEIAGLVFVVIAGTLSAVSVAAVLVYLFNGFENIGCSKGCLVMYKAYSSNLVMSPSLAPFVIIFMWTLAILFIAIPASIHPGDYYGNTGYCRSLPPIQVGYNVRLLFGASREPPVQRLYQQDRTNRRRMNQMALQMMFFASFLFSLSGFLNVILIGFTRRGIIPYPSHVIKSRSRTKSSFASPGMTNNPMTDTVASVYSQTGTYGGRFSQFPTSDYPFELKDAPPLPALPPPSALHGQPRNMDDFHEVTFAKPNYPPSTTDSKRSSYWI